MMMLCACESAWRYFNWAWIKHVFCFIYLEGYCVRAAWSRTSLRGHFGSSGPFFQVWATFDLCLTFSLALRGKHMLALISDSLVHCCAPWLFRLLYCLPGEGRMPAQRHSSRQPTRHDGEPWVTPTEQCTLLHRNHSCKDPFPWT